MTAALRTLAVRRWRLTIRTPRELIVPLMTPILFAVVIAPALKDAVGGLRGSNVDYEAFIALATVGLLIPLNAMFSGIGVIVDRETGARRELLTAPIPRPLLVLGNLSVTLAVTALQLVALIVVTLAVTALQLVALIVAALMRGVSLDATAAGVAWFIAAALLFSIGMYGIAETLANRIPRQEEYIAATPAVAIVPWFFAGTLFPIGSLPGALTIVAKVLPLTHALALIRYGLLDHSGAGLHDIWGMSNTTTMAFLSLGVVALFAVATTTLAIKVFQRSAVQ